MLAFSLPLSWSWQNGLMGNLSVQVEDHGKRQVSVCFLHCCLLFVCLQNEGYGHLCLRPSSHTFLLLSFIFFFCHIQRNSDDLVKTPARLGLGSVRPEQAFPQMWLRQTDESEMEDWAVTSQDPWISTTHSSS